MSRRGEDRPMRLARRRPSVLYWNRRIGVDSSDVAVIGGGIGGMISALYLAGRGYSVTVLEQNHHTGGNMSGFRRQGWSFDGGDQSFESLGIVFPILKELGVYDSVRWEKARFRMVSPDFDFFVDDLDGVIDALRSAFPDERGIPVLFDEVRQVSRFLERHCDAWSFPLLHRFSVGKLLAAAPWFFRLRRWLSYDYRLKICSTVRNPALRHWFAEIGYRRMPFIFFAGFWHLWMKDYWYPAGGMQAFNDLLAARFVALGGRLRLRTRIVGIESSGGRALTALSETGERIHARQFVYAGDYKRLVSDVLGPGHFSKRFVQEIAQAGLTEEILSVYLGLDIPPTELEHRLSAQHVFYFPGYEVVFPTRASPRDVHRGMWVAINHFGTANPQAAPPGKSSLVLQTYSSHDWQDHWRNGSERFPRSPAYREFKNEVGRELIGLAEQVLPGLGRGVEFMEVGTPLSIGRFSLNTRGSTGGWCYDDAASPVFRRPLLNLFRTPLANLSACGHYSLWPGGVISAALSGKIVAGRVSRLLGRGA
jgi:phytoene dehydrogenase-like protein